MKWLVVVLVFVPVVCESKKFGYDHVAAGSCSAGSDDSECVINQGIKGKCRNSCKKAERELESEALCPGAACKCCTKQADNCDVVYPGSYCGPAPCDENNLEISDKVLCDNHYVCCRSRNVAVAHPLLRDDHGTFGMKAHYHTFDGLRYMFPGTCTYLLLRDNTDISSGFQIFANHASVTDELGEARVMVKSVNILVNGMDLKLLEGDIGVMVNGDDIIYALEDGGVFENNGVTISFVGNHLVRILVEDKFTADWNGKGHLILELPDAMMGGKVAGLLGNANGLREDEMMEQLSDGSLRLIRELTSGDKPTDEEMIRFGLSWIKDCEEVD